MAEETHIVDAGKISKKRRVGHKKGSKGNKRMKVFPRSGQKPNIDKKLRELFRKRAREYNSDDEDEESKPGSKRINENAMSLNNNGALNREFSEEQGGDAVEVEKEKEVSEGEEEEEEIQPGITKFTEGCRTFRMAFKKIMKKNVSEESLGPVLSAHKKLIAAKLAEEDAERKVKGDAKKEKHLVGEKGHVKPANFLDSHEKFLIGVATKGVVKLFNAVNKAQNAQKGLNPSRSKDAKAIGKRRKEAFFSELGKTSSSVKVAQTSGDGEGPGWAPLRDNYMLANSKLKNWDKMPVIWIYDHFRLDAFPNLDFDPKVAPTLNRWLDYSRGADVHGVLVGWREKLDELTPAQVDWIPMKNIYQISDITWYTGCVVSFDIIEGYYPDRFARQMNCVQTIPSNPSKVKANRNKNATNYTVAHAFLPRQLERWEDHLYSDRNNLPICVSHRDIFPDYFEWFLLISHPVVVRPDWRLTGPLQNPLLKEHRNVVLINDVRKSTEGDTCCSHLKKNIQKAFEVGRSKTLFNLGRYIEIKSRGRS